MIVVRDLGYYLEQTQEVGFVDQVFEALVHVTGLPHAHPGEVVVFEHGEIGEVLTLHPKYLEVLVLAPGNIAVGSKVARTGEQLSIHVTEEYLGKVVSTTELAQSFTGDAGNQPASSADVTAVSPIRPLEHFVSDFATRRKVDQPLETGVTVADLLVPLARGQRELVIGDRKTGKTYFLQQLLHTQAKKNCVCIYAAIAKPRVEVQRVQAAFAEAGITNNTIIVASYSAERSGLIYLTPYIAMAMAEYFRDLGKDVVLVLDDLTTHARYYREVMLLAKRFPGRSSYPGDIFFIHARLLERAGAFKTGTITCLPVAQSVVGDLSGYIQTNIMSMTDGHIFFDSDLFDQGRRPAVNPFLSVTRVGEQTQLPLARQTGRQLREFLINYEKIQEFRHFQTELSESVKAQFELGNRFVAFLDQTTPNPIPLPINLIICSALWGHFWDNIPVEQMKKEINEIIELYESNATLQKNVDDLVTKAKAPQDLSQVVISSDELVFRQLREIRQKIQNLPNPAPAPTANPSMA